MFTEDAKSALADRNARVERRKEAINQLKTQSDELVTMRLKNLVSDEEFAIAKEALLNQQQTLSSQLSALESPSVLIEPSAQLLSLGSRAVFWFEQGSDEEKRLILQAIGSNLTLSAKKLIIEAAKPLYLLQEIGRCSRRRASVTNVGTGKPVRRRQKRIIARDLAKTVLDPKYRELFDKIKALNERLGPPPGAPAQSPHQEKDASEDDTAQLAA